jgi:DNA-binding transcriptional ArsR family regulator
MVNDQTRLLDATFFALADPTRRAMLERLSRGEASVTELAAPFTVSLPAISKHLRVLESAGLIVRRREGRVHRIAVRTPQLREAMRWLEEHREFWERRFDALERYLSQTGSEEA